MSQTNDSPMYNLSLQATYGYFAFCNIYQKTTMHHYAQAMTMEEYSSETTLYITKALGAHHNIS